ncbi:MAG: T9SS type A sorting domain-containing protein [Bacteroidota bacterium]
MKSIVKFLFLFLFIGLNTQAQIQNVIVEKYYLPDANDLSNTDGGQLQQGAVTYRVFIDLTGGSKVTRIFADSLHLLKVKSTQPFFNNDTLNSSNGGTYGFKINKNDLAISTVGLDTWMTIGAATNKHHGILKSDDNDGSIVGGNNNDQNLLSNSDASAGTPISVQDGLILSPVLATNYQVGGDMPLIGSLNDSSIFGSDTAKEFITPNATLQYSGGLGGQGVGNNVLVGQFTTAGQLAFELNISVIDSSGTTVNYVASGNDTTIQNEIYKSFPLLKYPPQCGCLDPHYIEYNAQNACNDSTKCLTLVRLGCMDTLACNYDPDANYSVPEMCCYPGYCNDRDIAFVCPSINTGNRLMSVYPNPTSNDITINLDGEINIGETNFILMNSYGKEIMNFSDNVREGFWSKNISLSNLVSGVYILKCLSQDQIQSKVIIKN